ncbi:ATPase family associated with various cellular activities (AAA) [Streptomyces sp. 2224.1]|nr:MULTISPECIES: GNAT family N-acetyltransferase [unclassified Streptomyces]PBC80461.1 ATPase family protein associated with various cellular activities (AAA) [Streptomyces sp. 2321.6]SDR58510.1 ATPase family associated with various cellular activities (AAA) [Streptomyces sp. KS_16]SEB75619.1 ATPase family associated with various cellular activities (AAA) [Streptomyces sp. 2133.1]SED48782.1 ATPase family associated with various cellular activities (AAA) [Streptomyces sp. 2224.1]SNC60547.1 ATPa
MNWLIHDYRENALAAVVHLIDSTAELGQEAVFSLAECISALTSRQPAVVAVHQGAPIGTALACVAGERGWVMRIAISSAWRGRGPASALLVAEPERAARQGVRPPRAIALSGPTGTGKTTFARGIAARLGRPFVELFPSRPADEGNLAAALRRAFAAALVSSSSCRQAWSPGSVQSSGSC